MNKIVCDICGTVYPDTAECCPICGSSKELSQNSQEDFPRQMPKYVPEHRKKSGLFAAAQKNFQMEFYDSDEDEEEGEDDEEEMLREEFPDIPSDPQEPRVHVTIVAALTVLIALLLLGSGYLFFRYELPNHRISAAETEKPSLNVPYEQESETTQIPTVPCSSIVLTAGAPTLTRQGQFWLLHVLVMPEDTTDELTYVSADETVVTVTPEGRLCAVGNGETSVTIACGKERIICPVTVSIEAAGETEASAAETEPTAAEQKSLPSEPDDAVNASEPEETSPSEQLKEVTLKLKKTDITFTKKGVSYQLELDCDLAPEEVTWISMDSKVAICHDGLITVLGPGTTKIVAQYGDQKVSCIVRCKFK
ncbi:MAG: hypothetical protein ACI4PL_06975 [Faecousia sp.]